MSDYNYGFHGCYELTLEISCCKYPERSQLPKLWDENRKALVEYVKEAHRGVTGIVLDEDTGLPLYGAILNIKGRDIDFYTAKSGEFWRLLLPGEYTLKVHAKGYHPVEVDFRVNASTVFPKLTFLKVFMVNETKPVTTSTTATTVTTTTTASTSVTTLRSTRRAELSLGKITTLDAPIFFKQRASRASDSSATHTPYVSPLASMVAFLLALFQ